MTSLRRVREELGPTLRLSVPIMLGMLGYGLMFITDVAMAGRLGETALAASALAGNLNYIPYVFGIGVVGAVSVYQSQDNGAGIADSSPAILRHGMALALVLSLALAALTHLLAPLIPLLGSAPEVAAEARGYYVIMAWAMVPGLLFHALRGHRDSQHQPWVSLAWLSAGLAANVLLNWVMMYGNWGCPALGLDGAAWATLLSRVLMLAGLWLTPGRGEVRLADGLSRPVFRRLLATGVPAGLHSLSEVGIFAVVPVMAGWISPAAQAAHQVAVSTASAAFMLPLGLGIGAGIRAGEARGAGDREAARAIGLGALALGGACLASYALLLVALREPPARRLRRRGHAHRRAGGEPARVRRALGAVRRAAGRRRPPAARHQPGRLGLRRRRARLLGHRPAARPRPRLPDGAGRRRDLDRPRAEPRLRGPRLGGQVPPRDPAGGEGVGLSEEGMKR